MAILDKNITSTGFENVTIELLSGFMCFNLRLASWDSEEKISDLKLASHEADPLPLNVNKGISVTIPFTVS
jgi:hypothetical protein